METPRSVLVVDDSLQDIELLLELFKAARVDAPLETVRSGNAAIQWLTRCDPDRLPRLVLADLTMPDGDGFDLLAWMQPQEQFKETLRVVLSSTRRSSDIDRCYALGANFFVSKFPSPAVLAALVSSAEKRDPTAVKGMAGVQSR